LDVSSIILMIGAGLAAAALVFPALKPIYDKWNIIFPKKNVPPVPVTPVIGPTGPTGPGTVIDGIIRIVTNDSERFAMLVNWRDALPEGNAKLVEAINTVIHEAFATNRSSATVAEASAVKSTTQGV